MEIIYLSSMTTNKSLFSWISNIETMLQFARQKTAPSAVKEGRSALWQLKNSQFNLSIIGRIFSNQKRFALFLRSKEICIVTMPIDGACKAINRS